MIKRFLRKLFGTEVKVIEVPAPWMAFALTPEIKESLTTLSGHPGFQYLSNKLRLQRAALESKLKSERHATLTDVEFLQSGIYWTKWLDDQISTLVYRTTQSTVHKDISADEMAAFREILNGTQIVGEPQV